MTIRAFHRALFAFAATMILGAAVCSAENRITILTDAFGRKPELQLDWGYAALIEYNGKRILFDTGDNIAMLRTNVESMHVDLSHLDAVVISHIHGDHTSGLRYVLELNPKVALFVPNDGEFHPREIPRPFLMTTPEPALAKDHRYFNGNPAEHIPGWQGYNDTKMTVVKEAMTVMPGVRLVTLVSDKPAFKGLVEVSMVLDTPKGPVVVAGCSHPGIERIMAAATAGAVKPDVYMLFGGLHLVQDTDEQINGTLDVLEKMNKVQRIAVGHCTGERAFYLIQQRWGKNDVYAGLGETVVF
jgi:7,8-dihydropterin-6-yl-methyl-4-(beta-D-ribofuranosyl)aminobenzene 5'-phosphate synthase